MADVAQAEPCRRREGLIQVVFSAVFIERPADNIETISIGHRDGFGLTREVVLITRDSNPFLQLVCYTESDEFFFKSGVKIWQELVVIGFGERVFTLEIATRKVNYIDLDAYFIEFYPADDLLLITSGYHLHVIDKSGDLLWIAENLACDGVIIDGVETDKIVGQGEIDPPNGWKPFVLDLNTGKRVK